MMELRARIRSLACIAMLALPGAIRAQTVRGEIVHGRDSSAIAGAVVQLLDASGAVVGRALSDDEGRFRLLARTPGPHRVRATYIGFRPVTTDALQLVPGQDATTRLSLVVIPPQLAAVNVTARQACRVYADAGIAAELWDQARTAFTAARLSPTQRRVDVTTVRYERELDVSGKEVLTQSLDVRSGPTTQPWVSLSADSLRRFGYVIRFGDGGRTYHAPDLDVLASDVFLEDHCLRVASESPDDIGIAFEPTRDRARLPEIAGTVLLNRRTFELRRMDFRYVNVSVAEEGASAGGDMTFLHVGPLWAIASWNIRMPVIERRLVAGRPPEDRVVRHKISGGELALVARRSDTLWARPPVTLQVSVVDSASGAPAADVLIDVRGTGIRGRTGADGRARIGGLLPGMYVLVVADEQMQALELSHERRVTLASAAETHRVAIPPLAGLLHRVCPGLAGSHGAIVGRVRRAADTMPIRSLPVAAQWDEFKLSEGPNVIAVRQPRAVTSPTRFDGTFTLCGIPLGTLVRLVTPWDDKARDSVRVTAPTRMARGDLRVDPPFGSYRGTIVDAADRRPILGVEVVLPLANRRARTASDGSFEIDSIPVAPQDVVFRRDGYIPAARRHSFVRDTVVAEQVVLAKVGTAVASRGAQELPAVTSRFDARRRGAGGYLINRERLDRAGERRLSDVLATVPGLRIINGGGGAWASTKRGAATPDLAGAAAQSPTAMIAECYCDIYVDGALLWATGSGTTPSIDLNTWPPRVLEAVEFFTNVGQIPAEFSRGGAACGVLMLWTRRDAR